MVTMFERPRTLSDGKIIPVTVFFKISGKYERSTAP